MGSEQLPKTEVGCVLFPPNVPESQVLAEATARMKNIHFGCSHDTFVDIKPITAEEYCAEMNQPHLLEAVKRDAKAYLVITIAI